MQPKDLVEGASHWVELIRGKVVAPANPTVRSSSGGRVIDFVVIDQRLGHAVHSIVADDDFPGRWRLSFEGAGMKTLYASYFDLAVLALTFQLAVHSRPERRRSHRLCRLATT